MVGIPSDAKGAATVVGGGVRGATMTGGDEGRRSSEFLFGGSGEAGCGQFGAVGIGAEEALAMGGMRVSSGLLNWK